jgi:hypothetical protein
MSGGYGGTGSAKILRDNTQVFLFQKQNNPAGKASIALQLERVNRSYYPWGVSFQVYFTDVNGNPADPGAFEIDIQTSDIDADIQYFTISKMTGDTSLNANFAGRVELTSFYAKYIRVLVATLPNPVYVSVLATR